MTREIEVERTARILKQAEPGHAPPPTKGWGGAPPADMNPQLIVAIAAGITAFVALLVALFH